MKLYVLESTGNPNDCDLYGCEAGDNMGTMGVFSSAEKAFEFLKAGHLEPYRLWDAEYLGNAEWYTSPNNPDYHRITRKDGTVFLVTAHHLDEPEKW